MELTWMGTAGFRIRTGRHDILLDPYITRNDRAVPGRELTLDDLKTASHIFITHGHFDHIADVPGIASRSGAQIHCSAGAARFLESRGVEPGQVRPVIEVGAVRWFERFSAQPFLSRHVRFDARLVAGTILDAGPGIIRLLPWILNGRKGRVLSWRFRIEHKCLLFFGSAGSTRNELERFAREQVDILLFPLQGHSDICDIAADCVGILKPGIVIPHHYDNYFPPLSKAIDINPFVIRVRNECRSTRVMVMGINEPYVL